jgi:hypothetical protein
VRNDYEDGEQSKIAVILSKAKDLQLWFESNECRFFASLRMTDLRESEARNDRAVAVLGERADDSNGDSRQDACLATVS